MMTQWQFEAALRSLLVLDMQELVDAGVIADRDYPAWDGFRADPVAWYLAHPAMATHVWRAISRHSPSSQMAEPPQTMDNVVDLQLLRRKEKR
jgi:hypothetical protein